MTSRLFQNGAFPVFFNQNFNQNSPRGEGTCACAVHVMGTGQFFCDLLAYRPPALHLCMPCLRNMLEPDMS